MIEEPVPVIGTHSLIDNDNPELFCFLSRKLFYLLGYLVEIVLVLNIISIAYLPAINYPAVNQQVLSSLCSLPLRSHFRTLTCEELKVRHANLSRTPPSDFIGSLRIINEELLKLSPLSREDRHDVDLTLYNHIKRPMITLYYRILWTTEEDIAQLDGTI